MASFHFNNGSVRSTVVRTAPGHYLEIRRNDITWSAAFRVANPDVKQRTWTSLAEWHKALPLSDPDVSAWKKTRGWSVPASATASGAGGDPLINLSVHMAYVMNVVQATEEEVFDTIMELSAFNPNAHVLRFLLGNPYEAISSGDILGALWEQGHILEEEERRDKPSATVPVASSVPLLKPSDLLPTVAVKKERSDSDMETDEADVACDLVFVKVDKMIKNALADVENTKYILFFLEQPRILAYLKNEENAGLRDAINRKLLDFLTAVTLESTLRSNFDNFIKRHSSPVPVLDVAEVAAETKKNPFALVEDVLAFNRRWTAAHTAAKAVAEKKTEPISFTGAQFVEEEEKEPVVAPTPEKTDPFAEINAVHDRVAIELITKDNTDNYKQLLIQQFVAFCLRPSFAALWRSSTFERIQMRATLMAWLEFAVIGSHEQTKAVIERFLVTYPV